MNAPPIGTQTNAPEIVSLRERIALGTAKIALARAQGTDVTVWDAKLAHLEQQLGQALLVAECRAHVAVLHPLLQWGYGEGLHRDLPRVNRARVKRTRAAGDPDAMSEEDFYALVRAAGPVTTFACVVEVYRERVATLAALGADPFVEQAALALVLGT